MGWSGWIQLLLFVIGLLIVTKPLGIYLLRVLDPDREGGCGPLEKVIGPVERLIYAVGRIDPRKQQTWKQYSVAMLMFSMVTMLATYTMLRVQDWLPLNPQKMPGVPDALAFNTAASFTANTCWQSYGGESTMSYWSQMVALVMQNFFSSAVGLAVCAALVRGIARKTVNHIGNFWVDLTRVVLYLFLPVCLIYAIFFISQGTPQSFRPYTTVNTVDQTTAPAPTPAPAAPAATPAAGAPAATAATPPVAPAAPATPAAPPVATQTIAQGPIASQVAIKMFGVDGDGYVNVNAAHSFENGTPLCDLTQVIAFMSVGFALTYYLGRMVKNQRHGWACWIIMFILMIGGVVTAWYFESQPNPRITALGVDPVNANMEGKEVRLGVFRSVEFGSMTTAAGCGAVNSAHDSFMPMAGFVTLFNQHLGEIIPGGIGSGLCGFLVYVFVSVFLAGLMIGRTPEYLGKKVEAYDVKLAALYLLAPVFACLCFMAWACVSPWGLAGLNNNGPHGLSEILYAYTSASANNGSAFGGLTCTPTNGDRMYNITMSIAILVGRYFQLVPLVALAGSLARKRPAAPNVGSFPVSGATFILLVASVILIVGALNFLPALAFGPIVEHFVMNSSTTLY